jgi:hypothetical protein
MGPGFLLENVVRQVQCSIADLTSYPCFCIEVASHTTR